MARILVTGAAGFIGSHTVERMLEEGHTVLGVDNLRTGRVGNLGVASANPRFQFRRLDVLDRQGFEACVREFSPGALVHLAALVSVPESIARPDLNFQLNVEATQVVAETARLCGVRRIAFSSSAAVYGDSPSVPLDESAPTRPLSPYGAAKLASEALLLGHAAAYGLTVVALRYFNVYGPRQDPGSPYSGVISIFSRRFAEGKPVTLHGDGRQTRDFVYVRDVARANLLAATGSGAETVVANLCTGRGTSLLELVAAFRRIHGDSPAALFEPARPGDIRQSVGRNLAARRAMAFEPEWSLEDGLADSTRRGWD